MGSVRIELQRTGAIEVPLPEYQTEGAAGMDLHAALTEAVVIRPLERVLVSTGVRVAIPGGFEAQVRPRSGLAARSGITVLNSPGTIDSDYRGEIKVLLINLGPEPCEILPMDRIAQIVFAPVSRAVWAVVPELSVTRRGEGGYGSTGTRHG